MRYTSRRRNPDRIGLDYIRYIVNQAIAERRSLDARDMMLLQSFLDAVDEQKNRPTENVKDSEWRAAVYRHFLDDPQALEQFAMQALKKFGPDQLSMMVIPELQERIAERAFEQLPIEEVYQLLSKHNRLIDFVTYVIEQDPELVRQHLGEEESEESESNEEEFDEDFED